MIAGLIYDFMKFVSMKKAAGGVVEIFINGVGVVVDTGPCKSNSSYFVIIGEKMTGKIDRFFIQVITGDVNR